MGKLIVKEYYGRMAKHPRAKRIEKQEIGVLNILLNSNPLRTELTGGDDDVPLIDGYVHLLGEQDEIGGNMLKVQIKPLKVNKNGTFSVTCGTDLLSHAHSSSLPVLLIGVDVENQTAYWTYLSPESVKTLHETQTADGKKSATLRLLKNKIIKKGVDGYVDEWKRICLHHRNTSNDRLAARYKRRIKRNSIASEPALLERIRTLQDFVYYRTNKGEYPLIEIVMEMSPIIGGTSAKVKIAFMELLQQIINDKTPEALASIIKLTTDEDGQVKKKAIEILKEASKYNYHVLNAVGYGPYRAMLDFIENQDLPEGIAHEMLRNLLNPDYEGTSETGMHQLTFYQGPLDATPFLKKLRGDAIKLLLKQCEAESRVSEKTKIIETLGYATHKSNSPFAADPDFLTRSIEMVEEDTVSLVEAYKKIIFPGGRMTSLYPVVYEVEEQISILNTRERKIPGVDELVERIRNDKGDYRLFSLLAGDEMRLRRDVDWREGEKQKGEELKELLESINKKNADKWYKRLDAIAGFRDCVEDWLYQSLRDFLAQIAEKNLTVAKLFAERALKSKTGLYFFFRNILWGLRKGDIRQWDDYVAYIAKHKLIDQVEGILMSYFTHGSEPGSDKIRDEDLKLVIEIATKDNRFSFLKSSEVNRALEYHSFRSLTLLSTKGKEVHKTLLEKIKQYPELGSMFADELGFALHCKWVKLDEWDRQDLETLSEMLVNIDRLDHNETQILHALGIVDFDLMMSVFERRIKHPYSTGYDAIPYHFEGSVVAFIRDNPHTKDIVRTWLEERNTDQEGMMGYHLGEFFNHIGGEMLREALSDLVATGKKGNLLKVMEMMPMSDQADPSLCLEIVAVTDDADILGRIDARMRQTGGGSGAAGENIFAREMRKNKARIEDVKSKVTDPKLIKFCEKVLANLDRDIERSEREHEQEMRQERQQYEDEHPANYS